jgi:hypothetical protein
MTQSGREFISPAAAVSIISVGGSRPNALVPGTAENVDVTLDQDSYQLSRCRYELLM